MSMRLAVNNANDSPEHQIGFDEFWCVYPRREAKKDAMKAWKQIRSDLYPLIINAAAAWRREWARREQNFLPLPATWLRGERWEDELPRTEYTHQSQTPVAPNAPYVRPELSEAAKALIARQKGMR